MDRAILNRIVIIVKPEAGTGLQRSINHAAANDDEKVLCTAELLKQ
jgi:hypothetical protein